MPASSRAAATLSGGQRDSRPPRSRKSPIGSSGTELSGKNASIGWTNICTAFKRRSTMPASNTANKRAAAPAEKTLVIKRTFDAPRDLLWKVWSDPVQAKNWWGPEGFTAPVVELDLRPGGKWLAMMRAPDGKELWQHGVYREIVPPEKINFTFIWDEHPEHEMLITITFAARGNKTDMVFRQGVFTSVEDRNGHEGGWNQSFDRFAAYPKTVGGRTNARCQGRRSNGGGERSQGPKK